MPRLHRARDKLKAPSQTLIKFFFTLNHMHLLPYLQNEINTNPLVLWYCTTIHRKNALTDFPQCTVQSTCQHIHLILNFAEDEDVMLRGPLWNEYPHNHQCCKWPWGQALSNTQRGRDQGESMRDHHGVGERDRLADLPLATGDFEGLRLLDVFLQRSQRLSSTSLFERAAKLRIVSKSHLAILQGRAPLEIKSALPQVCNRASYSGIPILKTWKHIKSNLKIC